MRNTTTIEIKRKAKLWGIYEVTQDGLNLVGKEITLQGKPNVKTNQYAIPLEKGHITFSMPYDLFTDIATKSDFIKEVEPDEN